MDLKTYLGAQRGRVRYVAHLMGWAPAYLSQMAAGIRPVPERRGADLERCCEAQVRRWDLFPADWHRIWPELIGTEGAPAVPAKATAAEVAHG